MKVFLNYIIISYLVVSFSCFSSTKAFSFSIGEEREVGEKLLYTVRASFEVLDDPDLHQYLERLGREVLDIVGLQFFDYHFYVIKNKDFNAFAAPSGLIFFHTGLIETMYSEDELVSVLAHEIGHVVKRHISSKISKGKKINIATIALVLAALALGGGAASEALLAGSMAAGQSASLHFSRLDEEEADLLAYGWMKELKRNPEGQEKMLQTMRQIARYRSGMVPQYLLTHPNPEARLDYVQSLIASEKDEIAGFDDNDDFEFLRFKYRILSQVKDGFYLRAYYSSILSSNKSSEMNVIMAKYGMAQLDRVENNHASSLKLLNEVIDYYGAKNILNVDKGIIEFESGAEGIAYKTLTIAYDNDRNNMYATFSLARVCFSLGMIEKAENLYKTVMFEIPEFSKVYYELGRLSAAKAAPGETSYYLGKYYLYEGKLKRSRDSLKDAVDQNDTPEELKLDAKRSLDLIERLEK